MCVFFSFFAPKYRGIVNERFKRDHSTAERKWSSDSFAALFALSNDYICLWGLLTVKVVFN